MEEKHAGTSFLSVVRQAKAVRLAKERALEVEKKLEEKEKSQLVVPKVFKNNELWKQLAKNHSELEDSVALYQNSW